MRRIDDTIWYRIRCSTGAILAVAATIAAIPARAEPNYPTRPVRIIVPYGPGGVADTTTRIVAQKLSERFGQQFVIENRPGAGGIVASKTGAMAAI